MHCRHRRGHHRHSPYSRIITGGIIIIVGIIALLGNLGILDARNMLQFWPAIFIIIGTVKLTHTRRPGGYLIGSAFVAAGGLMMLNNAGIIHFHWRDWWPAILILTGVLILLKGLGRGRAGEGDVPGFEQVVAQTDVLNTTAVMSGTKLHSDTQDFRGGELTAVMGGIELDLRQASIQGEAALRVFALWGGISIKVPTDWAVVVRAVPILGGVEDKTVPPMNPEKRLVIDGDVIMGGVEIKN